MNQTDRPENAIRGEGGTPYNMVEIERSRRQYMIRLGLTICFVLIFMDGGSQRTADNKYTHKENVVDGQKPRSETKYTNRINEVVNSQRSLYTNTFARNLTGVFHGHWNRQGDESPGNFLLQLRSSNIENVPDLDFVYGVVKVFNAGIRKTNLQYPVQGVYLATSGSLYLLSSMQAAESLFLQVPETEAATNQGNQKPSVVSKEQTTLVDSNISVNISANKVKNHEDMHRRTKSKKGQQQSRSLANEASLLDIEDGKDNLEYSDLYLEDSVLDDYLLTERFLKGSIRRSLFSALESVYQLISRDKRHERSLSTAHNSQTSVNVSQSNPDSKSDFSKSKSLAVGTTGMYIKLIDVTPFPSIILSNGTSTFPSSPLQKKRHAINPDLMQAIGESSLPITFKKLQINTGQTASPAPHPGNASRTDGISQSCQFVMNMNVPPINKDFNKDVNKDFFNQLVANITNSGIDLTKDSYIDMKNRPPIYATTIMGKLESPDCGMTFNVSAASVRLQLELVERKAGSYSIIASAVTFIQIGLLVVQLRYSSTPAALTKISILCISGQSLLDAALCIGHLVLCFALPQVFFTHFMWVAILKLLLFGVFEMRTVVTIYQARYAQEIAAQGLDGLRQRLAKVHFRFYAALFGAMFLALSCYRLPMIAIFIFYSYWIPQIVWNVTSGTKRPFHPLYYTGITLTRLFIPLYILGCPHNFLDVLFDWSPSKNLLPFSPASCIVLIFWSIMQISFIAAQDAFGPRFFLPSHLFPRAYDYFRPIPSHVLHGSLSHSQRGDSDRNPASLPDIESGGLIECVICYNVVETIRGTYMITPCDHIFHKECLSQWLSQKMECCICRSALPQIEE